VTVTADLESRDVGLDAPGLPALNEDMRTLDERLEEIFGLSEG